MTKPRRGWRRRADGSGFRLHSPVDREVAAGLRRLLYVHEFSVDRCSIIRMAECVADRWHVRHLRVELPYFPLRTWMLHLRQHEVRLVQRRAQSHSHGTGRDLGKLDTSRRNRATWAVSDGSTFRRLTQTSLVVPKTEIPTKTLMTATATPSQSDPPPTSSGVSLPASLDTILQAGPVLGGEPGTLAVVALVLADPGHLALGFIPHTTRSPLLSKSERQRDRPSICCDRDQRHDDSSLGS